MKYLNKKNLADGIVFSGALVNVIFIGLIMYYFVL